MTDKNKAKPSPKLKLKLKKETIRRLTGKELEKVDGGAQFASRNCQQL
jgi:hypothetical protein